MNAGSRDRITSYDFVATILWIGFVLAISFMEAPLRFQAEAITVPLGLQIGRLVFHALNICEMFFAAWIFICQCFNGARAKSKFLFRFLLFLLVVQTLILFLVLDPRTNAIIAGQEVGESSFHMIYIAMESVKLISLAFLAFCQLRDFKASLANSEL